MNNNNSSVETMDWTMNDLLIFRSNHQAKIFTHENIDWQYYDIGNKRSDITLVFLHGTTGSKDIFWLQIKAFENSYRILSFDLPAIIGVDKLSKCIFQILKKNDITNNIIIIGTSFGGFLAQEFCSIYENAVTKLILSNTFVNTEYYYQKYRELLLIEKLIPTFALKRFMKKGLLTITHNQTREYLLEQLRNNLSKKTLMSRLKSFTTDRTLVNRSNLQQILIIETIDDPLVPEELQDTLKRAYPSAIVKTFDKEANHFPYLTRSTEYTQSLSNFIKD